MTTPNPQARQAKPRHERDEALPRETGVERSFAPAARKGDLPCQVAAFADGRIEQARAGRVLMVCARDSEVGSQNWEPFARWLVDEVTAANAVDGALVLDLRRVDRLSSRGLRALAFAWRELAEGGTLAVCGLNAVQREIFAISQYDRLFEVYDDAVQAYRGVADRVRN
jgi:anti-anti-sigma factor